MSKKNRKVVWLVAGLVVFFIGWAIRSTFAYDYANKPLGGIIIAIGMLIIGLFAYKLLKR
jgi:hypothetical protein